MWSEENRAGSAVVVPFAGVTAPLAFVAEGLIAAFAMAGRAVDGLIEGAMRWNLQRQTRRELEALDDYMLDDIGLTRSMIEDVANDQGAVELWLKVR